jgi:hypothetical protein
MEEIGQELDNSFYNTGLITLKQMVNHFFEQALQSLQVLLK